MEKILNFKIEQNKPKCCGCQACFNICPKKAIKMEDDEKGFKYPIIDEDKCVKCGLCRKVCPITNSCSNNNEIKAYACINLDENIRKNSSSGGIFSLLALEILKQKGAVIGAAFDNDYKVKHICIENEKDLYKLYTSKYVQSDINKMYAKTKELLNSGRMVLFTGTPCQIEGLYTFLNKDYKKLYTQDLICHGVPSPKVWELYKEFLEKEYNQKIKKIEFRNKEKGWKNYYIKVTFDDDTIYTNNNLKDTYLRLFLKDIILRDSCYDCKFKKINRNSDITLADLWGIEKILPEFDDNKGTSLVVVNTNRGIELFNSISDKMRYQEINLQEAIKNNVSMVTSANKNKNTKTFFKKYQKRNFNIKRYTERVCKRKLSSKIKNALKRLKNHIVQK